MSGNVCVFMCMHSASYGFVMGLKPTIKTNKDVFCSVLVSHSLISSSETSSGWLQKGSYSYIETIPFQAASFPDSSHNLFSHQVCVTEPKLGK